MANKEMKARVQQKIDTSANWSKAINFIPLKGEIIVYSDINKIKIGDGIHKINNLSFIDDDKQNILNIINSFYTIPDNEQATTILSAYAFNGLANRLGQI